MGHPQCFNIWRMVRCLSGWCRHIQYDLGRPSSAPWEDHLLHLEKTMSKIQEAGLTLNVAKCEWAKSETKYLGYHLGNEELRHQVDKVEAVWHRPRPRTKKEVFPGAGGMVSRLHSQPLHYCCPSNQPALQKCEEPHYLDWVWFSP